MKRGHKHSWIISLGLCLIKGGNFLKKAGKCKTRCFHSRKNNEVLFSCECFHNLEKFEKWHPTKRIGHLGLLINQ